MSRDQSRAQQGARLRDITAVYALVTLLTSAALSKALATPYSVFVNVIGVNHWGMGAMHPSPKFTVGDGYITIPTTDG